MEKLFLKFVARAWKSLAVSLNCLIGLGNGLYIFSSCTSLTKKKKHNYGHFQTHSMIVIYT